MRLPGCVAFGGLGVVSLRRICVTMRLSKSEKFQTAFKLFLGTDSQKERVIFSLDAGVTVY